MGRVALVTVLLLTSLSGGSADAQVPPCDDISSPDREASILRDAAIGPSAQPPGTAVEVTIDERFSCPYTYIASAKVVIDSTHTYPLEVIDDADTRYPEEYGSPFVLLRVRAVIPAGVLDSGVHYLRYESLDGAGNLGVYTSPDHEPYQTAFVYGGVLAGDCYNGPPLLCP